MEMEEISKLVDDMFLGMDDSDMASYWEDFLEMCNGLLINAHTCHAIEFDEYVISLRAMLPWMLAYDRTKYGKALPDFCVYPLNLPLNNMNSCAKPLSSL